MQMWESVDYTRVCLEMDCIHPYHAKSLLVSHHLYVPSGQLFAYPTHNYSSVADMPQPTASFQRSDMFQACEQEFGDELVEVLRLTIFKPGALKKQQLWTGVESKFLVWM